MAPSAGFAAVPVDCPPSPCARLSRARTTTGTPPLVRDVAGPGQLAGLRRPGARIEVPVFMRRTRGALGGRLYPWQHGPLADFGARRAARPCGTYPARPLMSARALAAFSSETSTR